MDKSNSASGLISLPVGGGALRGIGEKFSPDLFTGTGNFTIPIELPAGRNGYRPELSLLYSSGNGNGPFGLGWSLSVPGISRKTSKGIPRYDDARDVFILSGAEDLVAVQGGAADAVRYRPRTEGLFALIDHHCDPHDDYWRVRSKDGLESLYGTPASAGADPAVVANPRDRRKVYAWKLTATRDPFGNLIEYEYERDSDQLYLRQIHYADYRAVDGTLRFMVSVSFLYADRPDPYSEFRAGFEIRTRRRCREVLVRTHADHERRTRALALEYLDERPAAALPLDGVSLLSRVRVMGYDDDHPVPAQRTEELPPIEFAYTAFEPQRRRFMPIRGRDLPPQSLASPDHELVDLFGHGLPDILEMNGTARYWRNLGNGQFDLPREMPDAPVGLRLADPDVQLVDANGDGRTDLLVTGGPIAGFYPMRFGGLWDHRSFQPYLQAPSFSLEDPEVRLVDLDGDGVTDALRSGARFECFFNDPQRGWNRTRRVERRSVADFPDVDFSDVRVRFADMSGDGLQDIALVYDGNIEYWPNLGNGDWGARRHMSRSPRFPTGYDPARIFFGDVDGDGVADLVYVDDRSVTLWINRSGNGWSDPIVIEGTPPVGGMGSVRLADMLGTGVSGVLWTRDADGWARESMFFLDFTGGVKPYLLCQMNNNRGAVTRVDYVSSTQFLVRDRERPETRWRSTLPFPVQVVSRVQVRDELSAGRLTTEYSYHHGYWDGFEREFRGFGRVEQRDTEEFERLGAAGLDWRHFSAPTLAKTWFHLGPVGDDFDEWLEPNWSEEYWGGDPQLLSHVEGVNQFLSALPDRRSRREALRALRGNVLRTELYAADGSPRMARPYTVSEHAYALREETPPLADHTGPHRVFFPHRVAERNTQWERGDDPMTQLTFLSDFDAYGQVRRETKIGCPRGWHNLDDVPGTAFLATRTCTFHAAPQAAAPPAVPPYIVDRIARTTRYEIVNDGAMSARALNALPDYDPSLAVIGQVFNYYDGPAFNGLPSGDVGVYGALVRTESLVLSRATLRAAYAAAGGAADPTELPTYLVPDVAVAWTVDYPAEFRHSVAVLAGYTHYAGGAGADHAEGYFVNTERRRYDFHDGGGGRGLVTVHRDPLGGDTSVTYGAPYLILPEEVTNAVGLRTRAENDYRIMQPYAIMDANGNHSRVTFSALGLPESRWVTGKAATEGDQARPSLTMEYGFLAYANSPADNRQPVFVRTVRRLHHDTEDDLPLPQRDETLTTVEYSDGFGRLLQTRAQAETVRFGDGVFGGGDQVLPANQLDGARINVVGIQNADAVTLNVVVSGWQSYDNKGQVIEKYEPFYSTGWLYRSPRAEESDFNRLVLREQMTLHRDPLGRIERTVSPDGSMRRVIFGVPNAIDVPEDFVATPWEAYTYDANDNAGTTHAAVSAAYQRHWHTPSSAVFDALGRTLATTERNGPAPATDWFTTRSVYDIRGNVISMIDTLGRRSLTHSYDLADRQWRIENLDSGVRRSVFDAAGNVIERRDSKNALILGAHDRLNRRTRVWARDGDAQTLTLRERLEYGDGGDSNQLPAARDANRAANRLGKLARHYDEAGLLNLERYDFKSNLLEKSRQVVGDANLLAVLEPAPANWAVQAYRMNWEPTPGTTLQQHAAVLLDGIVYRTSFTYDALNRAKMVRCPEDADGQRKVLRPRYNRAGALLSIEFDGETYVTHIAYNAQGQRVFIAYGNGIMTRFAYDRRTFRLERLRTERYAAPDALTFQPAGGVLQDFAYSYDLAGNLLTLVDRTRGGGILNNPDALRVQATNAELAARLVAGDALLREFEYDPLYRLSCATGRESVNIPSPRSWRDETRNGHNSWQHGTANQDNAPQLSRRYWERYSYDPAGNMTTMRHGTNGAAAWTRHFGVGGSSPQQWGLSWRAQLNAGGGWVNPPGNCMTHVGDDQPATPQSHFFDSNGNLTREGASHHFEWDYGDRMRVCRVQPENAPPSVHAHYLYGADGRRVKKLVWRAAGSYDVTVYVDDLFEHHRRARPGDIRVNNLLHVLDGQDRLATRRVGNAFPDDGAPALSVRYQVSDHLGSTNVVVGGANAAASDSINREEYFPYGETSFGSFARKRFRFTGRERDEESGLSYHHARYYAPWLARWASCDPRGHVAGLNLYTAFDANPMRYVDPTGTQSETSTSSTQSKPLEESVDTTGCSCSKAGMRSLEQLRMAFNSANEEAWYASGLNADELKRVHAALKKVAGVDEDLLRAYYSYYDGGVSGHEIEKASSDQLSKMREKKEFALTKPKSDTTVDPNILAEEFDSATLGTLLIHEFVHTQQVEKSGAGWISEKQEGAAYGVELVLAERSGATERSKQINGIKTNFEASVDFSRQFHRSYLATKILLAAIDQKPIPEHSPEILRSLSAGQARSLLTNFVSNEASAYRPELVQLLQWAESQLIRSSTKLPAVPNAETRAAWY